MPTAEWMCHRMWSQNWCIQIEIHWCLCLSHEWPATHFREMAWVPSKCFEESPKLSFCGTVLWDQQPSLERLCGTYGETKQSIPDLCKPPGATATTLIDSFLPNPYGLLASQRIYVREYVYDSIVSYLWRWSDRYELCNMGSPPTQVAQHRL